MARDPMRTVLRLRTLREEEARRQLAAAAADVADARSTKDAASARLASPLPLATDLAALRAGRGAALALREADDRAGQTVHTAEAAHGAALQQWRDRRADQRAVERLLERRDEQARAAAAVAEQAGLDELALVVRAGRGVR